MPGLSGEVSPLPQRLEDLVPEFIPSVPVAKYTPGGFFYYSSRSTGGEPMLYYREVPPFGATVLPHGNRELGIYGLMHRSLDGLSF